MCVEEKGIAYIADPKDKQALKLLHNDTGARVLGMMAAVLFACAAFLAICSVPFYAPFSWGLGVALVLSMIGAIFVAGLLESKLIQRCAQWRRGRVIKLVMRRRIVAIPMELQEILERVRGRECGSDCLFGLASLMHVLFDWQSRKRPFDEEALYEFYAMARRNHEINMHVVAVGV